MFLIKQITNTPKQKNTLILQDGSQVILLLEFKPMQLGWFITELTHLSFTVKNIRVVTSPNMLYQFKNQIPFGLACFVKGNQEPTLQEDFASGRAQLYILSREEVQFYTDFLDGQNPA